MPSIAVYPWQQAHWQQLIGRKERLPHALLFRGPEGIGKLHFVRTLSQALLCESPTAGGSACDTCQSCRWFLAGNHPDYREIQPEAIRVANGTEQAPTERKPSQQIGVDEVRNLQDFIHLSAHMGGTKVAVFAPAEALNANAANALLKNLEEPPPGFRFMLVAHRANCLAPTILSRCQQIVLPIPASADAEQWLRKNGVENALLSMAHTGGAPLAALELNDPEFWRQRKVLLDGLVGSRFEPLALAERIRDYPLPRFLGWLQRWSYDLLSAKFAGRVRYNPDCKASLIKVAERLRGPDLARFHRFVVSEQRNVHHPLNPRLFIEEMLLGYAALLRGEFLRQPNVR